MINGNLAAAGKILPPKGLFLLAGCLYLVGLTGDSWYGLAGLDAFWDLTFQVFTYSRNGLFFPPLFLLLGAWLGGRDHKPSVRFLAVGLTLSFAAMTAEAFLLRYWDSPRHDSMYLFLPVVMVFLYQLLLEWKPKHFSNDRNLSTVIYLIHPVMIVVVRGLAGVLGLTAFLVENSLIHYLAVCLLSFLAARLVPRLPF